MIYHYSDKGSICGQIVITFIIVIQIVVIF